MGGAGTNVLNHFERTKNSYLFNMLQLNKIIKRLLLLDLFFLVRLYKPQIRAFLVRASLVKRLQHLESETKGTFVAIVPMASVSRLQQMPCS